MISERYENPQESPLAQWLRKKGMTQVRLAYQVGCCRELLLKVKKGIPICPLYAKRIFDITGGEVNPPSQKVGRPW